MSALKAQTPRNIAEFNTSVINDIAGNISGETKRRQNAWHDKYWNTFKSTKCRFMEKLHGVFERTKYLRDMPGETLISDI